MHKKDLVYYGLTLILLLTSFTAKASSDPLPSWNEGTVKQSIIQFVHNTTDKNSTHYVAPENRIATIDNDGTMWVEYPMYTQVIFAFARVVALAPQHPEWKTQQPFAAVLAKQYDTLTGPEFEKILAATQSGMSVENFKALAQQWLAIAKDPRFHQHYTQLVYVPMLEMINYLRQNNFKVYIVSGGGQDFMRAFTQKTFQLSPEQIIGSAAKTRYSYQDGRADLIKIPQLLLVDDKDGKPEAIYFFIGKKPIIAIGNSEGDRQMLEWTQSNPEEHLMLLVHHDDAVREYAYDTKSKVGTFPTSLMNEAKEQHWLVISMKKDWKKIFSF